MFIDFLIGFLISGLIIFFLCKACQQEIPVDDEDDIHPICC